MPPRARQQGGVSGALRERSVLAPCTQGTRPALTMSQRQQGIPALGGAISSFADGPADAALVGSTPQPLQIWVRFRDF